MAKTQAKTISKAEGIARLCDDSAKELGVIHAAIVGKLAPAITEAITNAIMAQGAAASYIRKQDKARPRLNATTRDWDKVSARLRQDATQQSDIWAKEMTHHPARANQAIIVADVLASVAAALQEGKPKDD